MQLYQKGCLWGIYWLNIDDHIYKNGGCLSQLTTNQSFVLNYFQWRYLLMFVKFIFCVNRTKSYYLFKLKVWLWSYVSEDCLVNLKSISGNEPLVICLIELDSSDTTEILLEEEMFWNLSYSMFQNCAVWTAPVVHQPELSHILVSFYCFRLYIQ